MALLLCHGAFGHAHQLELTDAPAPPAAHADVAGDHHSAHHDADGKHPPGAYFAALLALLLGASLLPRSRKRMSIGPAGPTFFGRHVSSRILHPPRGPTLPSLQVFRL